MLLMGWLWGSGMGGDVREEKEGFVWTQRGTWRPTLVRISGISRGCVLFIAGLCLWERGEDEKKGRREE